MATVLKVSIHSDVSEFPTEKRYDAGIKVGDLKKKLELITGATHTSMKVTLSIGDKEIGELSDNEKTLGQYAGEQVFGDTVLKLAVKDAQPSGLLLSGDTPKFVISDEKYQQRPNNARDFIKEMREKRKSGQ